MALTERQAYALRRPTQDPAQVINDVGLWDAERRRDGNTIRSALSIDR